MEEKNRYRSPDPDTYRNYFTGHHYKTKRSEVRVPPCFHEPINPDDTLKEDESEETNLSFDQFINKRY